MKMIEFDCGTKVDEAARILVALAPASGDFNGVPMRANYATTRPRDVVRQWHRTFEERAEAWRRSPEGLRSAHEAAARASEAQQTVDECMATLERVGPAIFGAPSALLSWLDRMALAADHVNVVYDHAGLVRLFEAHGWAPNANCGDQFDGDDARNFAGWIVGQWLATKCPIVGRFVEQWRDKFGQAAPE